MLSFTQSSVRNKSLLGNSTKMSNFYQHRSNVEDVDTDEETDVKFIDKGKASRHMNTQSFNGLTFSKESRKRSDNIFALNSTGN